MILKTRDFVDRDVLMKVAGRRGGFKSWFVEPYRQVKLGLVFVLINIAFSILIFGVFGYYLWDVYLSVSGIFEMSTEQSQQTMLKFGAPAIAGSSLLILFVITSILVSVRYTYQIYGPLVSIHRFLDDIINGKNPDPIQLRQSDQLKELASKLNQINERLGSGKRTAPMVPVYRFIDELLAGKQPKKLQLRDQDQLNELVDKLNLLAEKIQSEKT
jgi:signal transduction histidine kinase